MAVGHHGLTTFVVWLGILSGCSEAPARPCTEDSECILQGRIGTCEAVGFCSYPDDGCASSAGFGPYAGEGLAGQCIGEGSQTSTGTSPSTSTNAAETSAGSGSTTETGSTGTCTADCGDPSVEPGPPIELADPVRLQDIVLIADGVAVGGSRVAGTTGWLARVDDDAETPRWVVAEEGLSEAHILSLDTRDDGALVVAGARGADLERPFLTAFEGDGALLWSRAWSTLGTDTIAGVATDRNEAWVAGTLDGRGWAERLDEAGVSRWSQQWVLDASSTRPEVVANFQGTLVSLGALGPGGGVRVLSAAGVVLAEVEVGPVEAVDVQGSLISVGDDVARLDAHGDTLWSAELDAEARGVASTYDGGAWVILSVGGDLEARRMGPDGAVQASVTVDAGVADGVAVDADSERAWLVVSNDDEQQLQRWRLSP